MKTKNLLAILFLIMLLSCRSNHIETTNENGISLNLAKNRKEIISNIHYKISLDIPAITTEAMNASEEITFNLSNKKYPLSIDFKENSANLQSIEINGKATKIDYRKEHIIIAKDQLNEGINNIKIKFIAGDVAVTRKPEFVYTLLVPEKARTFIPCFDQPDLKAKFDVTVVVPLDWEAISNGTEKKVSIVAEKKVIEFDTSDEISTYLFSIVAGKFQRTTRKINDKEINFYYRETDQEKINNSIDEIFDLHSKALSFLEDYTAISYPFKKFDFIAIPDFQYGGMEHVGAIDYKASSLFFDKTSTLQQKMDRANLIAHETSHMWFGNLVTMKWFNDVWMKEVFANFIADKVTDSIMPDNGSDFQFLLAHHPLAYYVDRTQGTNPIRQELANLDQAGSLYGGIIYDKAPIVMRQLEKRIGKELFRKALREYLSKYKFQNADWQDLIQILRKLSIKNIEEWNESWINKKGRPVINYTIDNKGGIVKKFNLTQNGEYEKQGIWKQFFTVAFVYEDTIKILPVDMDQKQVTVKQAEGLRSPLYVLFNATGEGYGAFPIDNNMLPHLKTLKDPLMRASTYINLYENVLDGKMLSPKEFLKFHAQNISEEDQELILNRIKRQFLNIYWQFILPNERENLCAELESNIQDAIQKAKTNSKIHLLFQLYTSIALTKTGVDELYAAWESKKGPHGNISEDDQTSLAAELAIRNHAKSEDILTIQWQRIQNSDSKARFKYLLPSLSNNVAIRDSFFSTLPTNIEKNKDWIPVALGYLHHPLRAAHSEKYLPKTLDLLEEAKSKGGIFFPTDWLNASFGSYQSKNAAAIVKSFLQNHPDYDSNLKRKILQETDDLFRTQKILYNQNINQ